MFFKLYNYISDIMNDFKEIKRDREDITQNLLTNVVFDEEKKDDK